MPLIIGGNNERLLDFKLAEGCDDETLFPKTGVAGRLEGVEAGEGSVEVADLVTSYWA